MKTTRLTFFEVRNRIAVGLCSRYRYKDGTWWTVTRDLLNVRRKTKLGIPIQAYMNMNNPDILRSHSYTIEVPYV